MNDAKLARENAQKEEQKKKDEDRKQIVIALKAKTKELVEICQLKMPGSKFDRFWLESLKTKLNTSEKLQPFIDFLQITNDDVNVKFKAFSDDLLMSEDERLKQKLIKEKEEAKFVEANGGWTAEESKLLNDGLKKYVVGTKERWLTISHFIGTKTQKEVIAKAKEIAERRDREAEERKEKEAEAKQQQIRKTAQPTLDKSKSTPVPAAAPVEEVKKALPENEGWNEV